MKASKNTTLFPPTIFNLFKPARMTSYDVIRHFKRHLPSGFGKIGHFGTLDPFASGVLMIGIGGAARLNDFIHDYLPKTYLAVGKLGLETPTGDYTSEATQRDDSSYFKREIASFSPEFIEAKLNEKFLGDYWQSPHQYSAAKFMGKNLHQWAREGVEIKKEAVKRRIEFIQVVKYRHPYLCLRIRVSSGTYIRTLFSEMSHYLGTLGTLLSLVREKVGQVSYESSLVKKDWALDKSPDIFYQGLGVEEVLSFSTLSLNSLQSTKFKNGAFLPLVDLKNSQSDSLAENLFWMKTEEGGLLGLGEKSQDGLIRPKINFTP